MRTFLLGKLHRATVTEVNLHYEGSLLVDADLLRAAGFLPYEQVHVINVSTGARFETYVLPAPAGSRTVGLMGGAARFGHPGDILIVLAYALLSEEEAGRHRPRIVLLDPGNVIRAVREGSTADAV